MLQRDIETVGNEYRWRKLPFEDLERRFVIPINALSDDECAELIQGLSDETYDLFRKKLWTEQDMPEENDGYNRTLNLCQVLKKTLLYRLPMLGTQRERNPITQQLAHVSLIVSPMALNVALNNRHSESAEAAKAAKAE